MPLSSDLSLRMVSCIGLIVFIGLAWLLSSNRGKFPWRIVILGTALQFATAFFVLHTSFGLRLFDSIGAVFGMLFDYVDEGAGFVFGPKFKDFYFAFKVLPAIIFFSSLMSILYYLGIMQLVVRGVAWVMHRAMGVSGAESLSAAANIFMGQTEAPLVIRPYLEKMTYSELNAVMVGGYATISGSLIAVYGGLGVDLSHLLTASVISAPAGLLIAKIIEPETGQSITSGTSQVEIPRNAVNLVDAATVGARDGLMLALNVAAMLIAFLALIKTLDAGLALLGNQFEQEWSLSAAMGYAFAPVAWIMGIEWQDCLRSGELLGLKTVANEFIAYEKLATWMKEGSDVRLQSRSAMILTYALCGFSNLGSIGIQIGGLGSLVPERRSDLARLAFRAMWGGAIACCMTACVAGAIAS